MKFIIDNIWFIALALVSGGTLAWPILQQRGAQVSVLQATQMINQGKTVIVDVRDAEEFATGHVREAKNIPLKELSARIGELQKMKSKAFVVVCQSGAQSSRATTQLKHAGIDEVYSLNGGLAAWLAQGLPTVK